MASVAFFRSQWKKKDFGNFKDYQDDYPQHEFAVYLVYTHIYRSGVTSDFNTLACSDYQV